MIDMFLTLPLSAQKLVQSATHGRSHLVPAQFEQLFRKLTESVPEYMKTLQFAPGGGAVNMAKQLAHKQSTVEISISGAVGHDEAGRQIADDLQKAGIHTGFQIIPKQTGKILYISYTEGGAYAGFQGVASPAAALDYRVSSDLDISGQDVFIEGFVPSGSGLWDHLAETVDPERAVMIDLGSLGASGNACALAAAVCTRQGKLIIFGTQEEMNSLYECLHRETLLESQAVLVIKDGSRGAWVCTKTFSHHQPAVITQDITNTMLTIGAGDALCAGFLAEYYRKPAQQPCSPERLISALNAGSESAADLIRSRKYMLCPSNEDA